ncbi:MAG TPA: VCBS repeat-containing protein [Phycisphaerales bacterium]|nr:VCBS repeat-containing protein [Phycisphaerales bacterium]|tara:strand:- start:356 stop:2704 length:2349 start_codon:yes stop_codon:yes gene_type:complete
MIVTAILVTELVLSGGFANFTNQTDARLICDPSLGSNDSQEKDYAWGDVDLDGDIDLVCIRKEPFTSTGRDINVLLMNENGVLTDRTTEYATNTDVSGDQGFFTPTNDRDIILHDLDLDGWLDMITVTTLTDNSTKELSHPRIYMNLGESDGIWQGFRFENARIPQMHDTAGPRFCSLAVGDISGDGFPDLYFGDYDSGTTQIFDYNNRLLINDGNAFFTDESTQRMDSEMLDSAFGAASNIVDMNGDGILDIVKQTSLNPPQHVAITYNDPSNEGFFNGYDIIDEQAPYFVTVGDLNGDGRMDLVVVDDGSDTYYLNSGNGGDGFANFDSFTLENSNGFGGNALIADINNDGHEDVIVTDVDVDISGCSRTTHIYRNLGNVPNISLSEQSVGISANELTGVHDVAVFDINGDGWLDIVMGRCNSTEVWIQDAPTGIVFAYPDGLPGFIIPDEPWAFLVDTTLIGQGDIDPTNATITVRIDGTNEDTFSMNSLGNNVFEATLPATPCAVSLEFKVSASIENGATFTDPPTGWYSVIVGDGTKIVFRDDMEDDVTNWSVINSDGLSTGAWERVDPNGTIYNSQMAAPEDDATGGSQNTMCFVTQNGDVGGSAGSADVDGGSTSLVSPLLDLEGTDGIISYARWFFDSQSTDQLLTYVSNDDGDTWAFVHQTGGTGSEWETANFAIGTFIETTSQMRVAFVAEDTEPASIVEAGIDNFQLEIIDCGTSICLGDVNVDNVVDVSDLLIIIDAWGSDDQSADIDGDGSVTIEDLLVVVGNWGSCSQ